MPDRLETERLVLRKARREDLHAIWNNVWRDDALAECMLWRPTRSLAEAEERMERTLAYQAKHDAFFVCLKAADEPIGFAGIRAEEEEGAYEESGICVARPHQGRGYGGEIVAALQRLVFDSLGGKRFYYSCFSVNERSRRLCVSRGFQYADSEDIVRDWDGKRFRIDRYRMDREAYLAREGRA